MGNRFWLSLISKFLFVLAWITFIGMIIYGAWTWWETNTLVRQYPKVYMDGAWHGIFAFLKIGFFGALISAGLMMI